MNFANSFTELLTAFLCAIVSCKITLSNEYYSINERINSPLPSLTSLGKILINNEEVSNDKTFDSSVHNDHDIIHQLTFHLYILYHHSQLFIILMYLPSFCNLGLCRNKRSVEVNINDSYDSSYCWNWCQNRTLFFFVYKLDRFFISIFYHLSSLY